MRVVPRRERLALFCMLALSVSCDGGVFVRALVRDPRSVPIDVAEVRIKTPRGEMKSRTDIHGCTYVGGMVAPGRYKLPLEVSAPGYKTLQVPVRTAKENRLLITLVPDDEQGPSMARSTKSLPCD